MINPEDNATCVCPIGSKLNEDSLQCEPFYPYNYWPILIIFGSVIIVIALGFAIRRYLMRGSRR